MSPVSTGSLPVPSGRARMRLRLCTETKEVASRPPPRDERSRRSANGGNCARARRLCFYRSGPSAQRAAEGEDAEGDAAQEQRDPEDDAEVRELLGHVA